MRVIRRLRKVLQRRHTPIPDVKLTIRPVSSARRGTILIGSFHMFACRIARVIGKWFWRINLVFFLMIPKQMNSLIWRLVEFRAWNAELFGVADVLFVFLYLTLMCCCWSVWIGFSAIKLNICIIFCNLSWGRQLMHINDATCIMIFYNMCFNLNIVQ